MVARLSLNSLALRVLNSALRGVVVETDNKKRTAELTIRRTYGEKFTGVQYAQQYGFTSTVRGVIEGDDGGGGSGGGSSGGAGGSGGGQGGQNQKKYAEALIMMTGDDIPMVLSTYDPRYRPQGTQPGSVGMVDWQQQGVMLDGKNGIVNRTMLRNSNRLVEKKEQGLMKTSRDWSKQNKNGDQVNGQDLAHQTIDSGKNPGEHTITTEWGGNKFMDQPSQRSAEYSKDGFNKREEGNGYHKFTGMGSGEYSVTQSGSGAVNTSTKSGGINMTAETGQMALHSGSQIGMTGQKTKIATAQTTMPSEVHLGSDGGGLPNVRLMHRDSMGNVMIEGSDGVFSV